MNAANKSVHFAVNTLALKRGGLVKAVRNRASMLAEHRVAREVWIEVLTFQPRLRSNVEALKRQGHLHRDVRVRSVLAALDGSTPGPDRSPVTVHEDPTLVRIPHDAAGRRYRYFRDGEHEFDAKFDRGGGVQQIDHFNTSRLLVRRDHMDEDGCLVKTLRYEPSSGYPTVLRYIGRDGRCFLTTWYLPESNQWGPSFAFGQHPREFANPGELYRYAFEQLVAEQAEPVLCSEFRENLGNLPGWNLDDVVRSVRHRNLTKVAVAHSSHLLPPYQPDAPVSPNWGRLLQQFEEWDAMVMWTESQREEIASRVGQKDRLFAIPPAAPPVAVEHTSADSNRLVLVARTHPKKRVDEAVRIFHKVLRCNPEARLEIFGFGYQDAEEAKIEHLINELGVTDNVRYMPFADDTSTIYAGATATLLTSISEGFGLALLESMSHGVPVVAYDCNYGPRDVIIDGENGYLVPFGDSHSAAEQVCKLMTDPALRERLGEGARRTLARFDASRHLAGWREALSSKRQ